jgi:hypothetical protein
VSSPKSTVWAEGFSVNHDLHLLCSSCRIAGYMHIMHVRSPIADLPALIFFSLLSFLIKSLVLLSRHFTSRNRLCKILLLKLILLVLRVSTSILY